MRKIIIIMLFMTSITTFIYGSDVKMQKQISQSNNQVCIDLFKIIDKNYQNSVFSSFSIVNALAMTAELTNEEISKSIRNSLQFPEDVTVIRTGFQAILNQYKKENKFYTLDVANAIWIDNNYTIDLVKQKNVEKYYLGESRSFDNKEPEATAKLVNKWCDTNTNRMIKEIITEYDINSLTQAILTNAVYFKGMWVYVFDEINIGKRTFYNSLNQEAQVDFMYMIEESSYTEDSEVKVLKMDYKGGDLSMLVLLPKKNDISSFKSMLTENDLRRWNNELKTCEVIVYLPKFKFDFEVDMNEPLKKLGMERAFTPESGEELFISKVKHKTVIDVNENGTEAAAVTSVKCVNLCGGPSYERKKFDANHPFIFVIQDNRNQNILFMGKVENPVY